MNLFCLITAFLVVSVRTNELETLKVCSGNDFRIFCDFNSILAIHEAFFTTDAAKANGSCKTDEVNCTEDIRFTISSKCSGLSQCHFNFTSDHTEKKCSGNGVVIVKYACVPEKSINKYCNVHLVSPSGYITSPGYPKFYPRLYNCSWTLQAQEGQRVALSFIDVSARLARSKNRCKDVIRVTEGNTRLLIGCGLSNDLLRTTISKRNEVKIRLASDVFIPSKGFLIYYKVKGCTRLPSPEFGYMVYNNGTSALYMCCKDHVFNDTKIDSRYLHCINDQKWNASIPSCIPVEDNNHSRLISRLFLNDEYFTKQELLTSRVYLEDVLIPITLMVVLLLGNALVIYFVVRMRRRHRKKHVSSETENLRNLSTRSTAV